MSNVDRCQARIWQDALDGELTAEGAVHLARCKDCSRRAQAIEWAAATTRVEIPAVPEHLEQRISDAARLERPALNAGAMRHGPSRWRRARFGLPRLAMFTVGIVLGAVATASLIGGASSVVAPPAIASDQFTRECPPAPAAPSSVRRGERSRDGQAIVVAGMWNGKEAENFKAVLRAFEQKTGASVQYVFKKRDMAETINARLLRNCPPDIAMLPQPGLLTELARDALEPLDGMAGNLLRANYSRAWRRLAQVHGRSYGVWFKAANKSNLWYSRRALHSAGLAAPRTWEQLKVVAKELSRPGLAPFSIAGQDGWTLTDWFENVYLRDAGVARYSQLARGDIPWTHPTVKHALRKLSEIFSRPQWVAGGVKGALKTSYTQSVQDVFGPSPRAAMLSAGDFVLNELAPSEKGDVGAARFPSIDGSPPAVVAGGDIAVLFRKKAKNRTARALMRYLATADAAQVWVRAGGFISPNLRIEPHDYRDLTMRRLARELRTTSRVRFDLSDMLPPAFAAKDGAGIWQTLQRYLQDPSGIDAITTALDASAAAAACETKNGGEC